MYSFKVSENSLKLYYCAIIIKTSALALSKLRRKPLDRGVLVCLKKNYFQKKIKIEKKKEIEKKNFQKKYLVEDFCGHLRPTQTEGHTYIVYIAARRS